MNNAPGRGERLVAWIRNRIVGHWKVLFAILANIFAGFALRYEWPPRCPPLLFLLALLVAYVVVLFFAAQRERILFAILANILAAIALGKGWVPARPLLLFFLLPVYIVVLFWAARREWESLVQPLRERKSCSAFCDELWHGWQILAFFVTLTLCLEQLPWFHHFENTLVDTFMRGKSQTIPQNIFVVEITKQDHKMFAGRPESPLVPASIITLIQAVHSAGAGVIGVDIDTCDAESCNEGRTPAGWDEDCIQKEIQDNPDTYRTVIWAEVPKQLSATGTSNPEHTLPLTLNPILGRVTPGACNSGIVRFEQEGGTVRQLQAHYKVHSVEEYCGFSCWDTNAPEELSSFYRAVITKYKPENPPAGCCARLTSSLKPLRDRLERWGVERSGGVYLDFPAEDLQRVQASEFMEKNPGAETLGRWKKELGGKIVLIGGTYEASDNYLTPMGRMPGVELLADAIASDLNGSIIPAESWLLEAPLDALAGLVIIWIYFVWNGTPWALTLSLASIVAALLFAWGGFICLKIWVNPIFVMAGMLAHQEYEAARNKEG